MEQAVEHLKNEIAELNSQWGNSSMISEAIHILHSDIVHQSNDHV